VDHLPNGWLAGVRRRMLARRRPQPLIVDHRDVDQEKAVTEWQRLTLCDQYGVPVDETGAPLNRGRWSR
jgi:hypothetical protein